MKAAILLNRSRARWRVLGKRLVGRGYDLLHGSADASGPLVLPEYDSFAFLLDPDAVVFGTGDDIPWTALQACDVLFWEWGWTANPSQTLLEVRRRTGVRTVMFPGPIDRFWAEVNPDSLAAHHEALRETDAVGVMLRDTRDLYATLMPWAHVFHMPVPVDAARVGAIADGTGGDPDLVLLTAPTQFTGPATQLPIASLMAFRRYRDRRPRARGLCFAYSRRQQAEAVRVLQQFGFAGTIEVRRFIRPLSRYLTTIAGCGVGIFLPRAMVQGRTALLAASIGLPMVLSEEVETHRYVYPSTSIRWQDCETAALLAARLVDDAQFRERVTNEARLRVNGYYSVDRCRERILTALAALEGSGEPRCESSTPVR